MSGHGAPESAKPAKRLGAGNDARRIITPRLDTLALPQRAGGALKRLCPTDLGRTVLNAKLL
jgi:hypothetical protein